MLCQLVPFVHAFLNGYGRTGNAFNASAVVFEVISDIDSKFAKIADKECDAVTGEVRKWFKRLSVRALSIW
jgi:hypothetical protein